MIDSEIIARQARVIEELKEQVSILERNKKDALGHIFCIGGPLNDNKLGFSKQQMVTFARIAECLGNEERPVKCLGQKTDPIGYIAFGGSPSGELFPLTQYTGKTEKEVGDKIMIGAKAEGWRGTVAERLDYLGWVILPVYMKEG